MRHDENGVENGSRVGDEDLEMSAMEDDAVLLARVHGIGGLLVCSCGRELTVEWCPSLSVDQKANAQLRTEQNGGKRNLRSTPGFGLQKSSLFPSGSSQALTIPPSHLTRQDVRKMDQLLKHYKVLCDECALKQRRTVRARHGYKPWGGKGSRGRKPFIPEKEVS